MRPRISKMRTLVGALLALGPTFLSAQTARPAKKPVAIATFRIAGTVVNSVTSRPLPRAQITVTNTEDSKDTQSVTSTDDGRFQVRVGAGKYSLQGEKKGFITFNYDQHENFWTGIVTGAGLDTENLVLRLPPEASITGTITDDNGRPLTYKVTELISV